MPILGLPFVLSHKLKHALRRVSKQDAEEMAQSAALAYHAAKADGASEDKARRAAMAACEAERRMWRQGAGPVEPEGLTARPADQATPDVDELTARPDGWAHHVLSHLTPDELYLVEETIMRRRPDAVVAAHLGISRRTLCYRMADLREKLAAHVDALEAVGLKP